MNSSIAQQLITYENNALIVKIKSTNAWSLNKDSIEKYSSPTRVQTVQQLHPTASAPIKKNDIDLRTVYKIVFQNDVPDLDELVKVLYETGHFDYVEKIQIQSISPFYVPNDPAAQPGNIMKYLDRMQAYDAWDIEQGDSTVIIGIIDTGFDLTHEDVKDNVAYNLADPINGIDDDADGYIDNYNGWDLGNNDNNPNVNPASTHGVEVSGIAAARGDNSKGVIGTGFKCKFLPIKVSPDGSAGISAGYQGIIYAADHNCKVINISWGGIGAYSQYLQDIINYAAINHDVVVVAAAGNTDEINEYYPAAYDNVLSVGASDTSFSSLSNKYIDTRANFTNWPCCYKATLSHSIDIAAQGMNVRTIRPGNTYKSMDGSSFATPMVCGAAGLIRSYNKNLSALQVIEQLRVTSDVFDKEIENAAYKELLGKGRLNMYRALTEWYHPSVRLKRTTYSNNSNATPTNGDSLNIIFDLYNYLSQTNELYVTISTTNTHVHWKDTIVYIGKIDSLTFKYNQLFKSYLDLTLPKNSTIEFRLGFIDSTKNYFDYQYFKATLNPEYIDLTNDHTVLTIPANGKLGFVDQNSSIGKGYQLDNNSSKLFEAGLILSTKNSKVSSTFRDNPNGNFTADYLAKSFPKYVSKPYAHQFVTNSFSDSSTSNVDPIGISVEQNTFTLNSVLFDHTVFIHLKLSNNSNVPLDSIYAGYFLDFDIGNYFKNQSKFESDISLAYVYDVSNPTKYYGIVRLTDQEVNLFAMDNSNVGGNNINPNDGFTNAEKFTASTSGLARTEAGTGSATGNDVSLIYTLKSTKKLYPNDTAHVAFAILSANSLTNLKLQAQAAIDTFKIIHTSKPAINETLETCLSNPLTINPTPGNLFQFYTVNPTSSDIPFYIGNSYTYPNYVANDTLYIECIDDIFPSKISKIILSDATCSPTNTQLKVHNEFALAPNPSTDFIQLIYNGSNNFSSLNIEVYNLLGLKLMEQQILNPSNNPIISTQNLSNGNYILKITTSDRSFVYSFIKSNY